MKKLLFNYYGMQNCCDSKFHGASEYGLSVLSYLVQNYYSVIEIAIIYNPQSRMEDWLEELLRKYKISKLEISSLDDLTEINKVYLADIFYSPTRLPSNIRTMMGDKVIIKETLHDFRGIELLDDIQMVKYMSFKTAIKNILKNIFSKFYRKYLTKKSYNEINVIDEIFCVSKHTFYSMNLLFRNIDFNSKKVCIYYSPAKKSLEWDRCCSINTLSKYILVLGGDRWTKNPYRTLLALDMLFSYHQYKGYNAIVIGEVSEKIKRVIKNKDNFQYIGYVETKVLEQYYANCEIFVYVSLNEGFGYPPIEAMKYGKTCVVSGTSSMPEVCGDAVYYVNPYNINEIAEKVSIALNEKINVKNVLGHYRKIAFKQQDDLKKLCNDIVC